MTIKQTVPCGTGKISLSLFFLQCYIYIFSHAFLYFSHQVSQTFCLRASAVPPSEPLACLVHGVNADGCKKPGNFALNRTAPTALPRMFYITCIGSIMFCLEPWKKTSQRIRLISHWEVTGWSWLTFTSRSGLTEGPPVRMPPFT